MLVGMTDAYDEPDGIAARGTVLVAAGRGETAGAYGRFGRRIAADGYRVRVLPDVTADLDASFDAAAKLLADPALPGPKVVAGSDTGALFALALATRATPGLDALILAGLPVEPPTGVNLLSWDDEISARTACPNHQRVLGAGATSLLAAPIPAFTIGAVDLPTLGLHGDADPISPLTAARPHYPGTLVTIAGGRHDVLNDVSHRTVAATVVLFLERLRLGADLPVIAGVR
jgi:alpha-beta hydrolase superfamily lysophospholipase